MSARAICQILESSLRAIGLRVSANIMTYSPHTNVILVWSAIISANTSYRHCGQFHISYIGIVVPMNL